MQAEYAAPMRERAKYLLSVISGTDGEKFFPGQAFALAFFVFIGTHYLITADAVWDILFYALALPMFLWVLGTSRPWLDLSQQARHLLIVFGLFFVYHIAASFVGDAPLGDKLDAVRHCLTTALFVGAAGWFCCRPAEDFLKVMELFAAMAVLGAAISLVLYVAGGAGGRIVPFGQSNHTVWGAFVYGLAALILAYRLDFSDMGNRLFLARLVGLGVLFALIFLAHSRGGLLALGGALVILLLAARRSEILWALLAGTFIGLILIELTYKHGLDHFLRHAMRAGSSHRMEVWVYAIDKGVETPWLGQGMATDFIYDPRPEIAHQHNMFIASFYHTGLTGLAVFLTTLVSLAGMLFRRAAALPDFSLLLALAGFAVLTGATDNSLLVKSPSSLWIFFWLPLSMAAGRLAYEGRRMERQSAS